MFYNSFIHSQLKNTDITLAKKAGMSLENISDAVTHSDKTVTQTYVNTSNVVPITAGEVDYRNLEKN